MQSGKSELNSIGGAAGAPEPLLCDFDHFVSSGGRVFHAAERPAQNMPAIMQGLRCLAHLPDLDWERLGPVTTAREFLQAESEVERDESEAWQRPGDRAVGDVDGVLVASPDRDECRKAVLRGLADTRFTAPPQTTFSAISEPEKGVCV